jgi:ubiquinol-cytochrome c reductase cytochrome c subunit
VMRIFRMHAFPAIVAGLVFTSSVGAAGSVEKGKAAFIRHGCWQCHGFVGQGAVTGAKLAPNPIPFEALSAFVRNTNGNMPPYPKAMLPDEDLADIYAYLQSVPKGLDSKSIPMLDP